MILKGNGLFNDFLPCSHYLHRIVFPLDENI